MAYPSTLSDIESFSAPDRALVDVLLRAGQAHVFAGWSASPSDRANTTNPAPCEPRALTHPLQTPQRPTRTRTRSAPFLIPSRRSRRITPAASSRTRTMRASCCARARRARTPSRACGRRCVRGVQARGRVAVHRRERPTRMALSTRSADAADATRSARGRRGRRGRLILVRRGRPNRSRWPHSHAPSPQPRRCPTS